MPTPTTNKPCSYSATVSSNSGVEVDDIRLVLSANRSHAPRMLGMGAIGSAVKPREWRWEKKAGGW